MNSTARVESAAFTLMKTLLFTLVAPCAVGMYIPYALLKSRGEFFLPEVSLTAVLGCLFVLAGAAGYFYCAGAFVFFGYGTPAPIDPPKVLVARGLYRFIRNPMYFSGLLVLLGESLLFESRTLLVYAFCIWIAYSLFVLLYEEPALRDKFGETYVEYCKRVPRWIPRIPRTD